MSRGSGIRTGACTKADARNRLKQAEACLVVSELCLDEGDDLAAPSVAAALAVLAAVAAGDAACCHSLGLRSRAQGHSQAAVLIATVEPGGQGMAKMFSAVIAAKDASHYGLSLVDDRSARALVDKARALTEWARQVLAS